ncbi:MAG: helix-turn-helix domain-containing protein [Bradymonadales bacterium]|nr:helix-turn-helix domain-containing protein [Bradymonadales bacterium]
MSHLSSARGGREGPLLVGIGSGAGGCGRTTLALELARAFCRRQVSTLVVDCATGLPIVAEVLCRTERRPSRPIGLSATASQLAEAAFRSSPGEPAVITLTEAHEGSRKGSGASPMRLMEKLRRLEEQVVLLDLPAGGQPFWLDLLILSDLPLVVATPEAWSVTTLWSFLRLMGERAKELVPAGRMRSYLVLNGCRDSSERDLGEVLCHALWRKLGHYPRYLGPVDFDDRRWFHLRHGDGSTPLSSCFGLGVQTEELARRILDLEEFDQVRPRSSEAPAITRPSAELLGLSDAVSPAEMRGQYRRLWEGYRRESSISQVLFTGPEREEIITELERTYRALQMLQDEIRSQPDRAGAVEAEKAVSAVSPRESGRPLVVAGTSVSGSTAEVGIEVAKRGAGGSLASVQGATPKKAGPREAGRSATRATLEDPSFGGHCGEVLQKVRKSHHLSLRELSLRTRIAIHHLEAIEQQAMDRLPLPVYLRGYLREIARVLDLPVDSLLDRYLSELALRRQADSTNPV